MAASYNSSHNRISTFSATVELDDVQFMFPLCTRKLNFGAGISVQYYWMDSNLFRIPRSRRDETSSVFAEVLSHWWHAMHLQEEVDEDQIRTLLHGACYPLVSGDRALQNVYVDAYLGPRRTLPTMMSVDDETRKRINRIVQARDHGLIRRDLFELFGSEPMTAEVNSSLLNVLTAITDTGIGLFREKGVDGMWEFMVKVDLFLTNTRRRGGDPFRRQLIDRFSYLCKTSFYLAYTNAWVSIIPWLRKNHGLDEVSERFLRFWHMQQQPREMPDGTWAPDLFAGQILSLHPLSGFLMRDPALCAVAGRFFATDAYRRAFLDGDAQNCPEYWGLWGAIMTAAHLYRQAHTSSREERGCRTQHGAENLPSADELTASTLSARLNELASCRGWACADCSGTLVFSRHSRAADDAVLEYICRACGSATSHTVSFDSLKEFF